ncbi:MAG TPA: adenosylcobinamide-GDP ribazoletransferase [Actinomycetes bacterium]|nr:adenosylcobinamide-GDP ribazoletransferase [Actinomycetes bacterium]
MSRLERRRGRVGETARLAVVALRFLTRLPLPEVPMHAGDLRRASPLFPLVGLVVAGFGTGVRAALGPPLGPVTAGLAAVAAMIAVTGALHEDGLADTADGLWGGFDRERRLAVMRDSRAGTYGVLALLAVVGLRAALLAPLDLAGFARAAACGHVLGRAATVALARLLPPAAPGRGAELTGPLGGGRGAVTALSALLVAVAATGWWAAAVLAAAALVLGGCAGLFRRRLGGITGDTLGAAEQLVELAAIAVVAALVRAGRA